MHCSFNHSGGMICHDVFWPYSRLGRAAEREWTERNATDWRNRCRKFLTMPLCESTFFISALFNGVPIITEPLHARDASIDRTRDGRHITPWITQVQAVTCWQVKHGSYRPQNTGSLIRVLTNRMTPSTDAMHTVRGCRRRRWQSSLLTTPIWQSTSHGCLLQVHTIVTDPTIQQPHFDLSHHTWSLINHQAWNNFNH